ncbi:uncharacterized protein DUF1080 [Anseongella ginsenosidimutans]|uniref:Uncharacterized protein DUF1080 n=1 Tax=Anseongella ginsenosidimutans TaxID=496056 RepID=A0A4R3KUP0_9SPHI|nr:DUF1080 domain-containing protein [Anseongella ginsenosidimutans]QEC53486.1 DUF1080 domain-containing protein [Anseongella ginsenosidimutans]TCS88385.1 uncharacterized protein DUF1080 [Anseongella ginsenosidimutans]
MKKTYITYATAFAALAWGCTGQSTKNEEEQKDSTAVETGANNGQNQLSEQEKAEGWVLLFNGQTTEGWKGYNRDDVPVAWVVEEGTLTLDTAKLGSGGGDIMTAAAYEDYELRLEWKISPNGNSGIIYNVVEGEHPATYHTGPEMQVLDNDGHPDGKIEKHRAGDLYDLIKSSEEPVKPVGEWNQVRLVQKDGKIEHWLNGVKIVEVDTNTPQWAELIAGSKFSSMPDFGKSQKGHIALQDHGNKVWYRNIKLKQL